MDLFLANVENFTENFSLVGCSLHSIDLLLQLDDIDYTGIQTPKEAKQTNPLLIEDPKVINLKKNQQLQLRVLNAVVHLVYRFSASPLVDGVASSENDNAETRGGHN